MFKPFQSRRPFSEIWQEIYPPLIVLCVAFVVMWGVSAYILNAPAEDLRPFFQFILLSSIVSLLVGYMIFAVLHHWLRTIRLKILLVYAVGIIIALVSIYTNSHVMFVSEYDFFLLGMLLIFASLLSASFGYVMAVKMTRSLCKLEDSAQQIAQGDLTVRVHMEEVDELSGVADAFNQMADELQKAFVQQQEMEQARRNLLVAISHDLRTPLASIRAMTEALADGVVSEPPKVRRYYNNIGIQIENLSELINDLFELSRLEAGQFQLSYENLNINDLLSDVVETMQAQANYRGIRLRGQFLAEIPCVQADFTKIQRVLYNLVQNAIRHTAQGGEITLGATATPEEICVTVRDTGEGIAPENLPYIFDQFFRGEQSRNRETGGSGLGLAIVKQIVEAHHGTINVDSTVGQGTSFRFCLPR